MLRFILIIIICILIIYLVPESVLLVAGLGALYFIYEYDHHSAAELAGGTPDDLINEIYAEQARGGAMNVMQVLKSPEMPSKAVLEKLKTAFRMIFSLARGTAFAATSATLQVAGEGVIPFDTISDVVFVLIESLITLTTVASNTAPLLTTDAPDEMRELLQLDDFSSGPEGIASKTDLLLKKMGEAGGDYVSKLCSATTNNFIELVSFVAQLISALVPDDAGLAQLAIRTSFMAATTVGDIVAKNPFEILSLAYNTAKKIKLPHFNAGEFVRKFCEENVFRETFIRNIFMFVRDIISARTDITYWQRFKYQFKSQVMFFGLYALTSFAILIPGFLLFYSPVILVEFAAHVAFTLANLGLGNKQVLDLLDKYFLGPESNGIKNISDTIGYLLAQAFTAARVLSECKNVQNTPVTTSVSLNPPALEPEPLPTKT